MPQKKDVKLAIVFAKQDPTAMTPETAQRFYEYFGITSPSEEASFSRMDYKDHPEAVNYCMGELQVADDVFVCLPPNPLPDELMKAGFRIIFFRPDGVPMLLKKFTIEAEPFFEEDRPQSAGDLIEEHRQSGDSACG